MNIVVVFGLAWAFFRVVEHTIGNRVPAEVDWSGLDAKAHEASLLSDLRSENELDDWHGYRDALIRLRFYYPKTYATLSGKDLEKRKVFETDEKSRK